MKDQDGGRRVRVGMSRSRIPRGQDDVGFAPALPPYICKSRSGRMRQAHVPDQDGTCLYCDRHVTPGKEAL